MGKTLSENLIFVFSDYRHIKPACCGIDKEYFRHQRDDWGETR